MIQTLIDFLRSLTDPEKLIHLLGTLLSGWYGYAALFAIVYSETGLLLGFFLPGDSLLFTVGVVAGAGHLDIVLVNVLLMTAAILGDSTAFMLGRQTGPKIFSRADSTFFKQEYVTRTHAFYAGVGKMPYLKFLPYSVCGGAAWIFCLTVIGYKLGGVPIIRHNFEKVILGIIVLSLLPSVIEVVKAGRASAR